jgi:hypothetical protein
MGEIIEARNILDQHLIKERQMFLGVLPIPRGYLDRLMDAVRPDSFIFIGSDIKKAFDELNEELPDFVKSDQMTLPSQIIVWQKPQ